MKVFKSQAYPEMYFIHTDGKLEAELTNYGDIKIWIWADDIKNKIIAQEELELLYTYLGDKYMPLFFNGRLL